MKLKLGFVLLLAHGVKAIEEEEDTLLQPSHVRRTKQSKGKGDGEAEAKLEAPPDVALIESNQKDVQQAFDKALKGCQQCTCGQLSPNGYTHYDPLGCCWDAGTVVWQSSFGQISSGHGSAPVLASIDAKSRPGGAVADRACHCFIFEPWQNAGWTKIENSYSVCKPPTPPTPAPTSAPTPAPTPALTLAPTPAQSCQQCTCGQLQEDGSGHYDLLGCCRGAGTSRACHCAIPERAWKAGWTRIAASSSNDCSKNIDCHTHGVCDK